jgi:hypothetical protein
MKTILFAAALLAGLCTFANDSGMPYIEAKDLTFKNADIGSKIQFRGEDAMSLYNALPSMDVMNSRHGFTANGQKKSVSIICEVSTWNDKKSTFIKVNDGPVCTITVDKKYIPKEEDFYKWTNTREPQNVKQETKKK